LVTGASSGIGAALAQRLAAEGTEVVICARRELELQRVAERIAAQGGRSHIAVLDVKEPRRTESAIKQLDEKFQFDLVIANAGVGRMSPGAKLNWDFVEDMINVNVSGSVATLLGALPGMLGRGHGHLVGVSSLAQGIGMPRNGTYLATKDLEPAGIIVTDVRPGIVDTPMSETISNRPFSISAEQAASAIVTGLHQRETIISFPYPAKLLAASFRVMPGSMFRSVMRWMDEGE
jgi:short-subunit dehydrogenase